MKSRIEKAKQIRIIIKTDYDIYKEFIFNNNEIIAFNIQELIDSLTDLYSYKDVTSNEELKQNVINRK